MRCTFFGNEEALMIKLVGTPHEHTAGMLTEVFLRLLADQGIRRPLLKSSEQEDWDARLWLTQTNGWTRLVLLVKIDKNKSHITFERWQSLPRPYQPGPQTRSHTLLIPQCVEKVITDFSQYPNVTILGAPMHLPIQLMFDDLSTLPPNVDPNQCIIIPEAEFWEIGMEFAHDSQ
ncbi:hypothetical protein BDV26DRAFT_293865 [Aspergillus bertholletiae]|uniref:Uncharacterized protein n=1 Tax=Aspergillus bertholletiae TaxID=1226010 RepID=A0A5N7B5C9_9EURO|nr:hypothetical protein BDV26DRAFT_293865 [Aspergillus bertholletiae]